MFKQSTTLVWIGILALSGMFLMGQEAWGPDDPGEFELIPAALLSVGEGETVVYEGKNPLVALDTVTLTFHGDGTFAKTGKLPAPLGAQDATGTWAYDGMELTLVSEDTAKSTTVTEVYEVAYTYNNGENLELLGLIQDDPGDGSSLEGAYSQDQFRQIVWSVLMDLTVDTEIVVTVDADRNWEKVTTSDYIGDITNDPPDHTEVDTETGGPTANVLYDLEGTYIVQLEDTYVLTRQ
jgi:hypothetical protein